VVVDGDRVVSTATLLDETLTLAGVPIPAGQVELVATDPDYEGRGLVRALMGWAHDRSAGLGQLAQVMLGIPYFYRQFGYAYAMPISPVRPVLPVPAVDGYPVRVATAADIPAMAALQAPEQARADLSLPHSAACWRWLVAREGSTEWLVEQDGRAVATGRTTLAEDHGGVLTEVAATHPAAAVALLGHVRSVLPDIRVRERPGTVAGDALEPYLGERPSRPERYYARVPDPVALLSHLRPVLSARLAAAGLADTSGEAVVSFFRSHVRMPYVDGVVTEIRGGGTMQAPYAAGGAGVAPDLLAPLLFGPDGIGGLSGIHPDVYLGPHKELMRALFPPVRSDLITFYVP
jgi:hypothetical protein